MEVNKEELRRLAEAAAHKYWYAGNAYDKPFIRKYQIITDTPDGKYVLLDGNQNFPEHCVANVAFVGAANPAAILSLLDELDEAHNGMKYAHAMRLKKVIDGLRADNEGLRAQLAESQANDRTAMGYLAEVRAAVGGDDFPAMVRNVQALRKDADRWNWYAPKVASRAGETLCEMNGHIDAAMAEEGNANS